MLKWSAEFHPRSLCSFGDSDGGPEGGGEGPGQTSSSEGGFQGDQGGFQGQATGGDSWTGSDTGGFMGDTTGGGFQGSEPGGEPGSFQGGEPGSFQGGEPGSFPGEQGGFQGSDPGTFQGGGFQGSDPGSFLGGDPGSFLGESGSFPTSGPGYQGWGDAGWAAPSNTGLNNAAGPPGWATSDFGYYNTGGPTNASIGGPGAYGPASPGLQGFQGDFGAPPGGPLVGDLTSPSQTTQSQFGEPNQSQMMQSHELGEQGRGWIGGPTSVDPNEAAPYGRGERSEAPNFFGPGALNAFADAASNFFGPSQAQAADRGTDQAAINQQSDPFAAVEAMASRVAQSNPDLAQALMGIVANQNTQPNMVGPMMTGFEQTTPGAQFGFTGVSPTQAAAGGPFTGQQAAFNAESTQGKGDRGATEPTTAYPGVQPGAISPTADPALQAALDARAAEMRSNEATRGIDPAQMQQMMQSFELGEQGRGPQSPNARTSDAFDALTGRGPGLTQTDFDSRFGTLPPAVDVSQRSDFNTRFGDWPVSPQAIVETISRASPEITTGLIGPESRGVGREAAPLGLLGMMQTESRTGGSPFGNPSQAGSRSSDSRTSDTRSDSRSDSRSAPLSVTVNPVALQAVQAAINQARGEPGYYMTGGRGIAPGAKGAEYGGMYGTFGPTGKAGTNTFGISSREGAFGYFNPATGNYYR